MKIRVQILVLFALLTSVFLSSGCASSDDDNLLMKAGFVSLRANTTVQLNIISKLSPDQILVLHKDGRTFYAFPDPLHSQIYIGNETDFARYRRLRASQSSRNQESELPLVENHGEPILSGWSDWVGWSA